MTKQAREVLEDCKVAAAGIRDGVSGREWRIRWVTCVALLRAVGHALRYVDTLTDPALKKVILESWERLGRQKPEPRIYWSFIEEERNNVLKEYRFGAGQGVTVRPGLVTVNVNAGEQSPEPGLPTLYHYKMTSGVYKGRDQRELLQEAIAWWDAYLRDIERSYASKT